LVDAARDKGLTVQEFGDRVMVTCPAHNDGRPSLSMRPSEDRTLVYCMAGCTTADVMDALGLPMSDLFDGEDGYEYKYPGGRIVKRSPSKVFTQSGDTKDNSLFGSDRLRPDGPVYITEGESDALAIESLGGQAVSSPNGASAKPARYDWGPLTGREVRVIADRDEPGRKRAEALAEHLADIASSVQVYEAIEGKDAADHIAAGYGLNDFQPQTPSDVLTLSQAFDQWREWRDSEAIRPIPTPWSNLNNVLAGGLHPGRVYIIAARVGAGKSLAGQNIVSYAVGRGHPSLVVSVEMPVTEIVSRVIAAQTNVDYKHITMKEFGDDLVRIDDYIRAARGLPMYLCDSPTLTIEQVAQRCRALKSGPGLDLAFIDYLQLLPPSDRRISRQEQVAHVAREAKLLAMELRIPVVLAAQLNRGPVQGDSGRAPRLSDIRESGEIEQSADAVVILSHEENSSQVIVNVAKNRTGPPKSISLVRRFDVARLDQFGPPA